MSFFTLSYCAIGAIIVTFLAWGMLATKTLPWTRAGAIVTWMIVVILAMMYCAAVRDILFNMGGSAVNGKVVGERYFLGGHGRYTEVSEQVWWFSYWHDRVYLWVTWVFIITFFALAALEARRRTRTKAAAERRASETNDAWESDSSAAGDPPREA